MIIISKFGHMTIRNIDYYLLITFTPRSDYCLQITDYGPDHETKRKTIIMRVWRGAACKQATDKTRHTCCIYDAGRALNSHLSIRYLYWSCSANCIVHGDCFPIAIVRLPCRRVHCPTFYVRYDVRNAS